MVANALYIAGSQVGSVTQHLSDLGFYRRAIAVNPTQFIDPSDRETRAIENDDELFSTVLHRISSPSFLPMEEVLNLPTR
jgi:hypothetical protein